MATGRVEAITRAERRRRWSSADKLRVERGGFVWPSVKEGALTLTSAQLAMLIEGLDWRRALLMTETAKPTAI